MNKTAWFVIAAVLLAALVFALPAISQQGPPAGGGPDGPGGPGGPGMGGPMGALPTPVMIVAATGVYVLSGPQLVRLDPETLKVLAKAELPRPEPPEGVAKRATGQGGSDAN